MLDGATRRLLANSDALRRDDRRTSGGREPKSDTGRERKSDTGGRRADAGAQTPDTDRRKADAGRQTPDTRGTQPPTRATNPGAQAPRTDAQDDATRTQGSDDDESTGLNIPLLLLAAGVAILAGALLARVGSSGPGTSVPVANGSKAGRPVARL